MFRQKKMKTTVFEKPSELSKFRRFSAENPLIWGSLLVLFFALLTYLIGPSYRSESLNFSPGEIARKTFVTRIPFTIERPNPNLEAERNKLAAQVPTYYVFSRGKLVEVLRSIDNAFVQARPIHRHYQQERQTIRNDFGSQIRQAELQLATLNQTVNRLKRRKRRNTDEPVPQPFAPLSLELDKAKLKLRRLRAEVTTKLELLSRRSEDEMRAVFLRMLGTEGGLNQEDVKAFIDEGFSDPVKNLMQQSLKQVLSERIVTDRRALEQDLERGIVWRYSPGGSWSLRTRDLKTITQQTARRMVDKLIRKEKELFAKNRNLERACVELARNLVHVNFEPDRATMRRMQELARNDAKVAIPKPFKVNEPIARKGDKLEKWQIAAIQLHHQLLRKQGKIENPYTRIQVTIAVCLFIVLIVSLLYLFAANNVHNFRGTIKDLLLVGVILAFSVLMLNVGAVMARGLSAAGLAIPAEAVLFAVPVAFGAMLIRLFLTTESALVYLVLQTLLAGLQFRDPRTFDIQGINLSFAIPFVLYVFISGIVGITATSAIKQRTSVWKAGILVSAANATIIFVLCLFVEHPFTLTTVKMLSGGVFGGILAAILLGAITPIIEHLFKYTTDIKLLELANLNAPIFKELLMRAPGTYHHSVLVGNLAEAAAETIGANGLMCRVAAYYHDLGKMKNPKYFAENQEKGDNPHDKLKPQMSALIIKSHVKDGREIAKALKLNDDICEVAFQHHGTALIKFFFHKAKQAAKEDESVNENEFRYPGPKPQTREAGILMLADTTEAAAKSLPDPSPARLKGLVQSVINGHFTDGQLDECELTLKDLEAINNSFLRVLNGIYHVRPQYPGQKQDTKQDTRKVSQTGEQKRNGKTSNDQLEEVAADDHSAAETDRAGEPRDDGDARSAETEAPVGSSDARPNTDGKPHGDSNEQPEALSDRRAASKAAGPPNP
ncbi:MAG: HDIG domain-containing protein [Myxococcales bacterium]|nr:HDIG domain-containing protein [Myxococcales bacterium]